MVHRDRAEYLSRQRTRSRTCNPECGGLLILIISLRLALLLILPVTPFTVGGGPPQFPPQFSSRNGTRKQRHAWL
jgi:hypothetical protein